MTNIVRHPALEVGQNRLLSTYRDELCLHRDRAVTALNTALASLTELQHGHYPSNVAPAIESFRVAAEAFAKIDPLAPPDAALVARMAEALDLLTRLTFDARQA